MIYGGIILAFPNRKYDYYVGNDIMFITRAHRRGQIMGFKIEAAFERNGDVYVKHGTATQWIASNAQVVGFSSDRVIYKVNGEKVTRYFDSNTGSRGVYH